MSRAHLDRTIRETDAGRLLALVARKSSISLEAIRSDSKFTEYSRARHVAAWALHAGGRGFTEVGRVLGRHPTTVLNSCRRVEGALLNGEDPALARLALDVIAAASEPVSQVCAREAVA